MSTVVTSERKKVKIRINQNADEESNESVIRKPGINLSNVIELRLHWHQLVP